MHKTLPLLLLILTCFATTVSAIDNLGDEPQLLTPDKAFQFSARSDDKGRLYATWEIADGYYLYRDKIRFSTQTPGLSLGDAILPKGKIKDDEFFGQIEIYRGKLTAEIPVSSVNERANEITLTAVSQGCADIGVCYPPQTHVATLDLPTKPATSLLSKSAALTALNNLSNSLGLGQTDDEFLDPDIAYQFVVDAPRSDLLVVRWTIAEGYYLYRKSIKITLPEGDGIALGNYQLPAGKTKHDEFFGDVEVYYETLEVRVPLQRTADSANEITLQLNYQGCADAGLCYPPAKKSVPVILAAYDDSISTPAVPSGSDSPSTVLAGTPPAAEQDDIARVLQESSLVWIVLFFFGAGVLLAFTACLYPMIPILSSIIVGHGKNMTATKGFMLAFVYVQALALTYAVVGVISAQAGAGVQAFFQNPWILGTFALIFVGLALSMFGFYSLQLPASLQARLSGVSNHQKGGSILGVAVMGMLSALIVGPCAGPVLIGALIYTSQSGDYLTGALAMFALGNGMGAPLLILGASGGKLLPKAGGWMDTVKCVFGVILLGVAILMLERVLPGPVTLMLWALLLIVPAIYIGALSSLPDDTSGWRKLWKGLGTAMLVYGIILILGAATGARDPLNPLRNLTSAMNHSTEGGYTPSHLNFQRIKSIEDFDAALARSTRQGKPLILDFYADWCTYCIKMEDYTFSDQRVQLALANTTLIQADVTANDETDLALLNHFNLFAPPAILFFGTDGHERRNYRLIGFKDADDFLMHLEQATN